MKRENRDGVIWAFLIVVCVVSLALFAHFDRLAELQRERERAAIWAEEMRKAGVPAGVGR